MRVASGSALVPHLEPLLLGQAVPRLETLRRVGATFAAVFEAGAHAPPRAGLSEEAWLRGRGLAAQGLARRLVELNGLRLHVSGRLPSVPSVLVANHLGYWDPLLLGALLPLAGIAKAELARWPLLGWCGGALATLYVRRGDAQDGARVLRVARRWLAAGVHLLNFPEGTTTDGRDVLAFRRGVFGTAAHAGVSVVPVGLKLAPADAAWFGGEAFLPHYRRHWRRGGVVEAQIRFGVPLSPRDYGSAEACAHEARARVLSLLGRTSS